MFLELQSFIDIYFDIILKLILLKLLLITYVISVKYKVIVN